MLDAFITKFYPDLRYDFQTKLRANGNQEDAALPAPRSARAALCPSGESFGIFRSSGGFPAGVAAWSSSLRFKAGARRTPGTVSKRALSFGVVSRRDAHAVSSVG